MYPRGSSDRLCRETVAVTLARRATIPSLVSRASAPLLVFTLAVSGPLVPLATAQQRLALAAPAPPITITDWLANVPADTSSGGRALVLEFWATWCGPCIAAVPHLNALHRRRAGEELAFLSLTYERPAAVARLLSRVDFETPVATDTTHATFAAFGDGEDLPQYPTTVLLDAGGEVRWVGTPDRLRASTLDSLVAGTLTPVDYFAGNGGDEDVGELTFRRFNAVLADSAVDYRLALRAVPNPKEAFGMQAPGGFFHSGATLEELYEGLFGERIAVAGDSLAAVGYAVEFVNRGEPPVPREVVEAELLRRLGLTASTERRPVRRFEIAVAEAARLPDASDREMAYTSDADGEVLYSGQPLATVADDLGKRFGVRFALAAPDEGSYDLAVSTKSLRKALKSLRGYGLAVTEAEVAADVTVVRAR